MGKRSIAYLLQLSLLLVSACGPGGAGGPALTTVSGIAVDGYLSNALAFYDLNDNGIADAGEPNARTGSDGSYALEVEPNGLGKHRVMVKAIAGQTVDSDKPGVAIVLDYMLATPPDHPEIVSPLTTLVVAAQIANPQLSSALAELQIKNTLGLGASTASLFADFAKTSEQAANPELIKLANAAKVIRTVIQTAMAARPAMNPPDVIKQMAGNIQTWIASGAIDPSKINVPKLIDDAFASGLVASAEIKTILEQLHALNAAGPCTVSTQCQAIGLGAMACGGPSSFLPLSTASPNFSAAEVLALLHRTRSAELLQSQQAVGICLALVKPVLSCVASTCQEGLAAAVAY